MDNAEPLVVWGTCDTGKPRGRLLLAAARHGGGRVIECLAPVWAGVEDKSQLQGGARLWYLLRWLASYPLLILRYLRLPRHRVVLVGYPGLLDVLILWPWARLRGARILWDVFFSLYDTVVRDRGLLAPTALVARLLRGVERLACRLADRPFLDTATHARMVEELLSLPDGSCGHIPVGAEPLFHDAGERKHAAGGDRGETLSSPPEILFYGQFIPLQGTAVIVEAARLLEVRGVPARWTLIGSGQEGGAVDRRIAAEALSSVRREPWAAFETLPARIAAADIVLGIFGVSAKARSVIPNKVYQALAVGQRLVTADTPALRELLPEPPAGVRLVPPGDAAALADAVVDLAASGEAPPPPTGPRPADLAAHLAREVSHALA
ncbi:MAG: glycosyltransferase [Planctomycetota bacterium]